MTGVESTPPGVKTFRVPSEYSTIAAALSAASSAPGVVLLAAGTYHQLDGALKVPGWSVH